jgi:glucokinase
MILAGDIGGTKTVLALFKDRGRPIPLQRQTFNSRDHDGLESVLKRFKKNLTGGSVKIRAACFGVAGPVIRNATRTINLPWMVKGGRLGRLLGTQNVTLLNDLEAMAHGVSALKKDDLVTLQKGRPVPGNAALIAAGTGLGEAILFWDGKRHRPSASEGGHTEFGPRIEPEMRLWAYLRKRYGHVSTERVVSGPGLVNLYRFLEESGKGREPAYLTERLSREDPATVIAETALSGKNRLCVKALDLFVSAYGAEAGNLALKALAVGGVYIGGGIAPKILPKFRDGAFLRSFADKGRYAALLSNIPVRVILNPDTALLGAALYARTRIPS